LPTGILFLSFFSEADFLSPHALIDLNRVAFLKDYEDIFIVPLRILSAYCPKGLLFYLPVEHVGSES